MMPTDDERRELARKGGGVMAEKKYLVDASGAELAACGECPIGRFDEDDKCVSEWRMCHQWRTEWLAVHEYHECHERTCHNSADDFYWFRCDACGFGCGIHVPVYCPKCGARVVDESASAE